MIRWYDYVAAFLVADFLFANFILAMTGQIFWLQIFGAINVALIWNIWNDVYCKFRLNIEVKKDE